MTQRASNVVPLHPAVTASHTATVARTDDGTLEIEVAGQRRRAVLATHLPPVVPGQRVVAVEPAGEAEWLVVAAWPAPGDPAPPPVRLDPATGTLHVTATRLDLTAVASIEITCGATKIRLGVDGRVTVEGEEIVSSALGAHRIEGGSVDIN